MLNFLQTDPFGCFQTHSPYFGRVCSWMHYFLYILDLGGAVGKATAPWFFCFYCNPEKVLDNWPFFMPRIGLKEALESV